MAQKITVVGSGIASLVLTWLATREGYSVDVMAPKPTFAESIGGGRFLYSSDNQSFLQALPGSSISEMELYGGIHLYHDGEQSEHRWTDLLDNREEAERITRIYADCSGRPWREDILNSVLLWDSVPTIIRWPTYPQLVGHMVKELESRDNWQFVHGFVSGLRPAEHLLGVKTNLADRDEQYRPYDMLVSTIPLWILNGIVDGPLVPDSDLVFTEPRYYTQSDGHPEVPRPEPPDSMTYLVGNQVMEVAGLPIKRVSTVRWTTITEYYEKPDIPCRPLPPNISGLSKSRYSRLTESLLKNDVHLLGRFAQMRPKMMLHDCFSEAENILAQVSL